MTVKDLVVIISMDIKSLRRGIILAKWELRKLQRKLKQKEVMAARDESEA